MNATPVEVTLPGGLSQALGESELEWFDRPQEVLEEPAPHSGLGQQVARLEQHGEYKAAGAVKVCGRLGEKWKYACGREYFGKIIRAHRRFCCKWCDLYIAKGLFENHLVYRRCLQSGGTLFRITVQSGNCDLSSESIHNFENDVLEAVKKWLNGRSNWGLKALTDYENGTLVAKAILALPADMSLPSGPLSVSSATITICRGVGVTHYSALLMDILAPTARDRGILRADLMAAFQGGRHLRSLGIFYGQISQNHRRRSQQKPQENLQKNLQENFQENLQEKPQEKLHLSFPSGADVDKNIEQNPQEKHQETLHQGSSPSGASLDQRQTVDAPSGPPCPHCGLLCRRTSVSILPIDLLQGIPQLNGPTFGSGWDEMENY